MKRSVDDGDEWRAAAEDPQPRGGELAASGGGDDPRGAGDGERADGDGAGDAGEPAAGTGSRLTASRCAPPAPPSTSLLNKPVGVMTTLADPEGRPTVRDPDRGVRAARLSGRPPRLPLRRPAAAHQRRRAGAAPHPPALRRAQDLPGEGEGRSGAERSSRRWRSGVRLPDGPTAPPTVRVLEPARAEGVALDHARRGQEPPGAPHVRGGRPAGREAGARRARPAQARQAAAGGMAPPGAGRGRTAPASAAAAASGASRRAAASGRSARVERHPRATAGSVRRLASASAARSAIASVPRGQRASAARPVIARAPVRPEGERRASGDRARPVRPERERRASGDRGGASCAARRRAPCVR